MAERVDALSIKLQNGESAEKLSEAYGKVIDNIQANTISSLIKNKDLSGDIRNGSVEAKRFVNVTGNAYGTARSAGHGQNVKAKPVQIPIDDKKEYIEEVEGLDIVAYGVDGLIARRTANHQKSIEADNEETFFNVAVTAGTQFVTTKTKIEDIIEEAIQKVETTKNQFVRGVPRTMINVICSPAIYGALRNKIAELPNANANVRSYEQGTFNNTRIFSTVFLPTGIDYVVMVDGAVAQPERLQVYAPKKIELSDATGFGAFVYKGTKAVMEDLIIYQGTKASI